MLIPAAKRSKDRKGFVIEDQIDAVLIDIREASSEEPDIFAWALHDRLKKTKEYPYRLA